MPFSNSHAQYGGIAKTFHWLTALLILTLIPLGWFANQLPFGTEAELTRKAWLFSLHKTLGVTAFFVALLRILWALGQTKPALLNGDHRIESFAAELVHWLLYGALVIVPLSGWISQAAAAGFAPIWWPFGQGLPLVPKDTGLEHFAGAVHWVATKLLIFALFLHIAGALKHHLIDRDATLRRMLPGTPSLPNLPQTPHRQLPLFGAVGLWVAVIFLASAFHKGQEHNVVAAPALAEVSSQWQVEQGEISFTVKQFGNEVTGRFADWTADITFDADQPNGVVGKVVTTISIRSLTLGSITDQALGVDFLDGTNHPNAVFDADISVASDGYEAVGTLTIKEISVPVRLPFALNVQGDSAEMRGDLKLDRQDFGVGHTIKDEATLGFGVDIKVTLSAVRQGN